MRVVVDRDRCEGHGMCEALAPDLFRVGDDDVARPRTDTLGPADRDVAELAVDSCPVQALRLEGS
ncbi:ferredoxin [Nocardia farcinica]|uniref:Ferredoxin n=1 Tax=Nocardia farcinica TaxID=37329 RepID=A0A449GPL8_NOCFR|nr:MULTISPECIES: ferredoxin [Nocardia]MBF6072249.1 ferredoxin [Nocardia farcinica]MBF6186071.1 ferredoxin [Nocardia farcinica]MBF6231371.1 ferredoxin [Nocardia farcinica]MBF6247784.1 ferredoxin [Nocardia elegans]MBF6252405.1 ferredoxin [Nocardia farcinica]